MKKVLIVLLCAFAFGLECKAQFINGDKTVLVGTVRTDGFQKITKGAFWSKRPEAKIIQEGSYPLGFRVYTLSENYFIRFADEEHNNFDRNYIIFPPGEKIYSNEDGQYFAAICGNRIDYIRPVNLVKIVKVEKFLPPKKEEGWIYTPPKKEKEEIPNLNLSPVQKEQKKIKIWIVTIPIVGIGGFLLLKKKSSILINGGPGGSPLTH